MSTPSPIVAYDPAFLGDGLVVPLPELRGRALANSLGQGRTYDYTYYTAAINRVRKLPIYSAANVDGQRWTKLKRPSGWSHDSRVGKENHIDDRFYSETWTRGHLTRRNDLCWGPKDLADRANHNSFYYSNAAPQHKNFNGDEWGELEDWFLDHAVGDGARAMVVSGPIFRDDDPVFKSDGVEAKVPAGFWKIIAIRDPRAIGVDLTASAFIMKQTELWNDPTGAKLSMLTRYQVPITLVEKLTCLDFGALRTADPVGWNIDRAAALGARFVEIKSLDDVVISSADRRRATRYPLAARSAGCGCERRAASPSSAGVSCGASAEAQERMDRLERLVRTMEQRLRDREEGKSTRGLAERSERILGGVATTDAEFKDCVYVDAGDYLCTGVLIGPDVVVTAAHCLFDGDGRRIYPKRVFIGSTITDEDDSTEWIAVKSSTPHESYDENGDHQHPSNDIAVLVLKRPATRAVPVEIISPKDARATSTQVTAVGFGTSDRNASGGQGVKRKVRLPITHLWVDDTDDGLRWVASKYRFHLQTEFVSIDPENKKDTCPGDSGGPVYIVDNGRWRVFGLTSRGFAQSKYYCSEGGSYTLVYPFEGWIRGVVAREGGTVGLVTQPVTPVQPTEPTDPVTGDDGYDPHCC